MFLDDQIVEVVKSSDLSSSDKISSCVSSVAELVRTNLSNRLKRLGDSHSHVNRKDIRNEVGKAIQLYEMAVDKLNEESSVYAILSRSGARDYWLSETSPLKDIL